MKQRAAWAAAGYEGFNPAYTSKLFRSAKCQKRMAELSERAADKATNAGVVTRAQVLAEFDEVRILALAGSLKTDRDGNPVEFTDPKTGELGLVRVPDLTSALRATEGKGKACGIFIDVQSEENLDDALKGKNINQLREQLASDIHDLDPNLHKQAVQTEVEDAAHAVTTEDEIDESVPLGTSIQ